MWRRNCRCRYNVARARTLEYIITPARVHGCTRRQVASLCKWELNGMLVGMQDSSLQGAQCIIELRTVRCNGWAWRFRDPFSLSLFTLSFYIRAAFCTCSWNDDNGTGQTKVSLFLPWHLTKNESLRHLDGQIHSTIIREDRLIR